MGILEQTVRKAFHEMALRSREHSGDGPRDGVDEYAGGDLASGEHVVADRDLLVDGEFQRAFVDALVMPAQEYEPAVFLRQLRGALLGQQGSLRGEIDDSRRKAPGRP